MSVDYYARSAGRRNPVGAGHYAQSLQFGRGCCEDLEAAVDHYDFVMQKDHSFLTENSGRCFRALDQRHVPKPKIQETRPEIPSTRSAGFVPVGLICTYEVPPVRSATLAWLGRGGFGEVTLHANPKKQGSYVAVKRLSPGTRWSVLMREVEALIKLQHPCVIPILGWFRGAGDLFGIMMQFASNGALSTHLGPKGSGLLGDPTRRGSIICDIVLGMRFIHEKGFMHRDLKPSNILLDENFRGLISDFGLSRELSATGAPSPDTGTRAYAAPEQLIPGFPYDNKVDVYSFGLIAYEIVTGGFAADRSEAALPAVLFGSVMQSLILRCWSERPSDRPSFAGILNEIERNDFAILPHADRNVIRQSVSKVRGQEQRLSQERR
jgi:hypothetical protein